MVQSRVKTDDYAAKLARFEQETLFGKLPPEEQAFIHNLALALRLTYQEFRQVVEAARDLEMWREGRLSEWWRAQQAEAGPLGPQPKQKILQALQQHLRALRRAPKVYPQEGLPKPRAREKYTVRTEASDRKIHGLCPVASESTVCCNLRTIDAVQNCAFGCSYCTIQTFYHDQFVFDANLAEKLKAIPIEPNRFYHFGTGQASDSLVWGNRNGLLDTLCAFAADHPNVLLEFKTKSDNVRYFLENPVPPNVVCSWSLNTPTIIRNEEHFTASLQQRLEAARQVADRGVGVAFHFHPMVYYRGWDEDYPQIAATLLQRFAPEEVLFLSFGSVTLIKPVIKQIRRLGQATKTLQMELVPDPHGKLTYPDDLKIRMFRTMYQAFAPWHGRVFLYLCMEKAEIWQATFGRVYPDNEAFERDFGHQTMRKLPIRPRNASPDLNR